MTLNIILVGAQAIYVSTDYRLSDAVAGRRVEKRGHKIVSILGMPGLVAFTGIAETKRGVPVGEWLAEQFPLGSTMTTAAEAVERLKGADDWLRHWPRSVRGISFTLATYEGGRPLIALVSNFEDLTRSPHDSVDLRLSAGIARPDAPWVFATGLRTALKAPDRRRLERQAGGAQSDVMALLAEVNVRASRLVGPDLVSEACSVGLIEPTGRMASVVFNDDEPFANIPPEWVGPIRLVVDHLDATDEGSRIGTAPKIRQWASSSNVPPEEPRPG